MNKYTFRDGRISYIFSVKHIENIYSDVIIEKMFRRVKNNETPLPHVFTIGAKAVHNMREERKDQSVLISGESGAGKTGNYCILSYL